MRARSGRTPRDWTVLGTPVPRLDAPALAAGTFEFVQNVRVPGMLHGRVVRPPAVGATLVWRRRNVGQRHAGVREGRGRKNFVGVVAQKPWQATQTRRSS